MRASLSRPLAVTALLALCITGTVVPAHAVDDDVVQAEQLAQEEQGFSEATQWVVPDKVNRTAKGGKPKGAYEEQGISSAEVQRMALAPATERLGVLGYYPFHKIEMYGDTTAAVNLSSGNLVLSNSTLSTNSPGISAQYAEFYNSLDPAQGSLGGRWRASFGQDIGLIIALDAVTFRDATGISQRFTKSSTGTWVAPAGFRAQLRQENNGGWLLTYNNSGEKLTFASGGQLLKNTDRNDIGMSYSYTNGKVTSMTDAAGRVSTIEHSTTGTAVTLPDQRKITYSKNTQGRLINVGTLSRSMNYIYDLSGRVSSVSMDLSSSTQNNNLYVTSFAYDSGGRVTAITQVNTVQGSAGATEKRKTTLFSYGDNQATITDPMGNKSTINLDAEGRQISAVDQLGRTKSSTWTANSDVQSVNSGSATGGPAGDVTQYEYDALGNRSAVRLPTGAAATTTYVATATCPSDGTGDQYQVKCGTDAQGNRTSASYDSAGNLLTTTNLGTNTKNVTYKREVANRSLCNAFAGMVCATTDENGKTTTYEYNANGDLTGVSRPAPLGKTTIGYDQMSRPTTATDPAGTTADFTYTSDDRRVFTTYNGDSTNNRIYHARDYEAMAFTYDALDSAYPEVPGKGTVDSLAIKDGIFGDPLSQTKGLSGDQMIMDVTSDLNGNLTNSNISSIITGVGNRYETFSDYDAANQMTRFASADGATCTPATPAAAGTDCLAFNYDAKGRMDTKSFPGGTKQNTVYDASNRPTRISVKTSTGSVLYDVAYSYKGADGLDKTLLQSKTSFKEEGITAGAITTYTYDSKNRLTAATEKAGTTTTATWAYGYDNAGNRTNVTYGGATGSPAGTTTYTYNAANQVTASSRNATGWTYDASGNLTQNPQTGVSHTYGVRQETLTTTKGTTKLDAKYWAAGNTGRGEVNGSTELRTRLGLMAIETPTGSTQYTRDPQGKLVSSTDGTAKTYYVTDKQGSVVLLLDAAGQKVGGYSYDPYGITRAINGAAAQANPFRYIGGQLDSATGLYKFGARYYDPAMGRFTQLDPSGQDPHYTYAANDPCNKSDPTGLSADCFFALLAVAGLYVAFVGTAAVTAAITPTGIGGVLGAIAAAAVFATIPNALRDARDQCE